MNVVEETTLDIPQIVELAKKFMTDTVFNRIMERTQELTRDDADKDFIECQIVALLTEMSHYYKVSQQAVFETISTLLAAARQAELTSALQKFRADMAKLNP